MNVVEMIYTIFCELLYTEAEKYGKSPIRKDFREHIISAYPSDKIIYFPISQVEWFEKL